MWRMVKHTWGYMVTRRAVYVILWKGCPLVWGVLRHRVRPMAASSSTKLEPRPKGFGVPKRAP